VEIKRRLNSSKAFCLSVQNLLSLRLLSKTVKIRIYETIILPVFLYGCETWSLKLRVEHRLRVFENRMLRKIFGPKRNEVTGGCRKLHNEELHKKIKKDEVRRACSMNDKNVCRILVGKPEGKRPLGR
jgi:hypothetical protein